MISIFNRKELLITHDMKKQSEVLTVLRDHEIEYSVKVRDLSSPPSLGAGNRALTGSAGIDLNRVREYKIYVKAVDHERALYLTAAIG